MLRGKVFGRPTGRGRPGSIHEGGEVDADTLLVLLSDHGHAFGEHGYAGKVVTALYPELTDIAFMIRHPEGRRAGETSDFFAQTHDVAPTVLGHLGIESPGPMQGADLAGAAPPKFVDGHSLAPLLDETPTPEEDWRQRFLVEAVAERDSVPRPPFVNESDVRPLLTGDPLPRDWRLTSAGRADSSEE